MSDWFWIVNANQEYHSLTSTDTLSVVTLAEESVNTTDRESETSLGGTARTSESIYIHHS